MGTTLPTTTTTDRPGRLRGRFEVAAMEAFLMVRGLLFRGRSHRCPVCGTGVRGFTHGGGSLRPRDRGYCPRCNSKARHRRVWLHCRENTDLLTGSVRLLHVSPKYCLSRTLTRLSNVDYTAIDVVPRPHLTSLADLTALPFPAGRFDGVLCIHVLEHIEDDEAALREVHRTLRPGGWAVINVPARLDRPTYEDATLTDASDRRRAFGEADHVRVYGGDFVERLAAAGFEVTVHRADVVDATVRERYGLTSDEHVFHCTKPRSDAEAAS